MRKNFLNLLVLIALGCSKETKIKNIIVMIGDGMGPAVTTAYRYYNAVNKTNSTNNIKATIFDELFVGKSRTYSKGNQDKV